MSFPAERSIEFWKETWDLCPEKTAGLSEQLKLNIRIISWTDLFSNGVLTNKDEKDETASEKVNTSYDSEKELSVWVAVDAVMISMQNVVKTFKDPQNSHYRK